MYDIVSNPIPRSDLWATRSLEDIYEELNDLSKPEQALAWHYVMLTLNACNQLVEDRILSKEIFAQ